MKRIPIWILYLADAMCVVSALIISSTYFIVGLPMNLGAVALCAFMVLCAASILCTAQILQYKYEKLAKEKTLRGQTANIEENFNILFKHVSAIKRDNSTLNSNFTALLTRVNEVAKKADTSIDSNKIFADINALKAKLQELENKVIKEEDITNLKLEIDETLETLRSDVEIDLTKLEDIDNAVNELKGILENIKEEAQEDENFIEAIETDLEGDENDIDEDEGDVENFEDNIEEEEFLSDNIADVNMMSRAFANIQDSNSILSSFSKIQQELESPQEEREEAQEIEEAEEVAQEQEEEIKEESYEEIQELMEAPSEAEIAKKNEEEPSLEEEAEENFDDFDIDEDDLDEDLENLMSLSNDEDQSEEKSSQISSKANDNPQEAVIIVNAMVWIGNKLYLRSDAQGLSLNWGVPMEFVEIGKWKYVFKNIDDKTKISIWLNDETKSDNGDIYINAGEILEIDSNFKI